MMRFYSSVFIITNFFLHILGQSYAPPLNIPLALAGNFGELRTNHFHMGLDFSTNGREGLEIRSIADGFISRVKVSPFGYGKALYIQHPDGHTSVYAHCSKFNGKLDSVVLAIQQREQNADVDIYFTVNELPVKTGQVIAFSGNTGRSSGPHLHFEIRDTKTGDAFNPLLFGFNVPDHRDPTIRSIKVYALDKNGFSIEDKELIIKVNKREREGYAVDGGKIEVPAHFCSETGGIGFSVLTNDQFDGLSNSCGIYESSLKMNDTTQFQMKIDRIAYDHTRYINSHMDHAEFLKGNDYHRLYCTSENPLGIYADDKKGILKLKPGDKKQIAITVIDRAGNSSKIEFPLMVKVGEISSEDHYTSNLYYMPKDRILLNSLDQTFSLEMKPSTLYSPLKKDIKIETAFRFGDCKTPIQKELTVFITSEPKIQVYLEVCTEKGGTTKKEVFYTQGVYIAYPKNLGTYTLKVDSAPPVLLFNGIRNSIISWTVKENETELSDYDLFINGKWVLLEYESKSNLLFAHIPGGIPVNSNAEIIVSDLVGNVQTSKISFNNN